MFRVIWMGLYNKNTLTTRREQNRRRYSHATKPLLSITMESSRYVTVYHLKGLRYGTPNREPIRVFKATLNLPLSIIHLLRNTTRIFTLAPARILRYAAWHLHLKT